MRIANHNLSIWNAFGVSLVLHALIIGGVPRKLLFERAPDIKEHLLVHAIAIELTDQKASEDEFLDAPQIEAVAERTGPQAPRLAPGEEQILKTKIQIPQTPKREGEEPAETNALAEPLPKSRKLIESQDILEISKKIKEQDLSLYEIYIKYYNRIREQIAGQIHYPLPARARNISGRVCLEFVIDPEGKLKIVQLLRPSSHNILNLAALNSIKKASPFEAYPKEIPRKNFRFTIPIIYELE